MEGILSGGDSRAKEQLQQRLRFVRDAETRTRFLVMIHLLDGRGPSWIAEALKVSRSTVYRTAERFRKEGEAGLYDGRQHNGQRKLTEHYLRTLVEVVASDPADHGWTRPTWTRELLVRTMQRITGTTVAPSTMSYALWLIGARRGRPKPMVECPWPEPEKQRTLDEIQALLENLPEDEAAVFEDEVDIHLNPKIGPDWMLCGQQKQVLTPGKNEKRYLAGAQDVRTGELIYVEGQRKDTILFVLLLWELVQRFPQARTIHVILDNYAIHTTRLVQSSLETPAGSRIKLHFLPPYCPDHNRIERTWQDLHANVTRNHKCGEMDDLMRNVRAYIRKRNRHQRRNAA